MIASLILKFKGIEGVDSFLAKHEGYFENKSYSQTVRFIRKYLDHEYQERDNNFAFLNYLDDSKTTGEFYAELIRPSKFFKTMSDKGRVDLIDAYLSSFGDEAFINEIINNISNIDALKDLVRDYVMASNASTVAYKLLQVESIDLILESKDYWYYLQDYLNADITDYYSFEDIKTYLLNYSNHNHEVIKVLTNCRGFASKEDILEAISDIVVAKSREMGLNDANKNSKSDIVEFLQSIFNDLNNNDFFTKEDLNYIAKKIEDANNKEALIVWVSNSLCSYNYQILDKIMLDYDNLPVLFNAFDKSYINYITTRILMGKSKLEKQKFKQYISDHYNLFDQNVMDKILFLAYTCSYKLSKEEIYGFLLKGSRYVRQILENYDFSEEERIKVFQVYKDNQYIDLCTLYGTYLIKGEKSALLSGEEEEKFKPLVLSLKKKIDDNKKLEVIYPKTKM